MAEFNEGNNVGSVFKQVNFENENSTNQANGVNSNGVNSFNSIEENNTNANGTVFTKVETNNLPIKPSVWTKMKTVLFKKVNLLEPVNIELTPYQQKVENEINDFLHQEISFKGFFGLFKSQK